MSTAVQMLAQETLTQEIRLPALDYLAMGPMLVLFGGACLGILIEAFASRRSRPFLQFWLSLIALVAALVTVVRAANNSPRDFTADTAIAVDGPALFLQGTVIVLGMVALLLMGERRIDKGGPFVAKASLPVGGEADRRQVRESGATEVFPLTMFATGGMMLLGQGSDLIVLFLGLELVSITLYVLAGFGYPRLSSEEAAMKYIRKPQRVDAQRGVARERHVER